MNEKEQDSPKLPRELVEAYRETIAARDAQINDLRSRLVELQTEHENLATELAQMKGRALKELPARAKELGSFWLRKKGPDCASRFLFRDDPVYGQLTLHEKLLPILSHPLFQRLNYVRQLSFAYLTFPCASHTRMSHVLGAAKIAQEAIRKVVTRGMAYRRIRDDSNPTTVRVHSDLVPLNLTNEQVQRIILKAQLCGLLHDIGHGPFGHALDKLVPYFGGLPRSDPPDTLYSIRYIRDYLAAEIRRVGFEPDEIISILDKNRRFELTGWDVFIADLIASPIDVDRMDYLARDAHTTGLKMGFVNTEALLEHIYPIEDGSDYKVVFAPRALCHMEHLAQAHHNMYIQCYEHPRKVAAERFLTRAVRQLLDAGLAKDALMLLTDDQLLTLLSDYLPPETPGASCLLGLRENLHFIEVASYHLSTWSDTEQKMVPVPELSDELKGWYTQRGQEKTFLRGVYVEAPNFWEEQICQECAIKKEDWWRVIVNVPAYEAKLSGEKGAFVVVEGDDGLFLRDFYDASSILRNILHILMPEREALRVFVTEDMVSEVGKLRRAANAIFKREQGSPATTPPAPCVA